MRPSTLRGDAEDAGSATAARAKSGHIGENPPVPFATQCLSRVPSHGPHFLPPRSGAT